jgi:Ca2+/Na+ antiporter
MEYDILEQYDNIIELLTDEGVKNNNKLQLNSDNYNEDIILNYIFNSNNKESKDKILFENYNNASYKYKYDLNNIKYYLRNYYVFTGDNIIVSKDDSIIDIDVSKLCSKIMIKYLLYLDIVSQLYSLDVEDNDKYRIKSRYVSYNENEWGLFTLEGNISYYRFIIKYTIHDNIIINYTIHQDDNSQYKDTTNINAMLYSFREDILKHLNYIHIIKSQSYITETDNYLRNIHSFYLLCRLFLNYKISNNFIEYFNSVDSATIKKNLKTLFIKFVYSIKNNKISNQIYYKKQDYNIDIFNNNLEIKKSIANTNKAIVNSSYKYRKTVNEKKRNENKKRILNFAIFFGIIALLLILIVSFTSLSNGLYYIIFMIILIIYIFFYIYVYFVSDYREKFTVDLAPYTGDGKSDTEIQTFLLDIKSFEAERLNHRKILVREFNAKSKEYSDELARLEAELAAKQSSVGDTANLVESIRLKKLQIEELKATYNANINQTIGNYNTIAGNNQLTNGNRITTDIQNLDLNYIELNNYIGGNVLRDSLDIISLSNRLDENISKVQATSNYYVSKTNDYNTNIKVGEENAIYALIAEIERLTNSKNLLLARKAELNNSDLNRALYTAINNSITTLTGSIFNHNIEFNKLKTELSNIKTDTEHLNINNYSQNVYDNKKSEYLAFVNAEKQENIRKGTVLKGYLENDIISKLKLSDSDKQIYFVKFTAEQTALDNIKKETDNLKDINSKLIIIKDGLKTKLTTLLNSLPPAELGNIPFTIENVDDIVDRLKELINSKMIQLDNLRTSLDNIAKELVEKKEILRITTEEYNIINDRFIKLKEGETQYEYLSQNKNVNYDINNIKKNMIININNSMSGISDLIVQEGIKKELIKVQNTEEELDKLKYKSKNDYEIQILTSKLIILYSKLIFDTILLLIMFIISFMHLGNIAIYIFIIIYIIILYIYINKIKYIVRTRGNNYYWIRPDLSSI